MLLPDRKRDVGTHVRIQDQQSRRLTVTRIIQVHIVVKSYGHHKPIILLVNIRIILIFLEQMKKIAAIKLNV